MMMNRLPGDFFPSYCSLQNWPLKTCNQDISKIIIAWIFKLGQLIEVGPVG